MYSKKISHKYIKHKYKVFTHNYKDVTHHYKDTKTLNITTKVSKPTKDTLNTTTETLNTTTKYIKTNYKDINHTATKKTQLKKHLILIAVDEVAQIYFLQIALFQSFNLRALIKCVSLKS